MGVPSAPHARAAAGGADARDGGQLPRGHPAGDDHYPLLISIVALCGGALAGLAGVVLAVPLAAAAQVLVQEILRERHDGWKQAHRRELAQRETGRGAAEEGLLFGGPMEDPRQTPPVKAEHADAPESHGRH